LGPAGSGSFVPPLPYAQPQHGGVGGVRQAVQQQQQHHHGHGSMGGGGGGRSGGPQQPQQHPPGASAHNSRHSHHGHSSLADDRGSATGSGGSVASSSHEPSWGGFGGSAEGASAPLSVGFQPAWRAGSGGGSQYGAHQSRSGFEEEGPYGGGGTGTSASEPPWGYGGGGWGGDDASSVASSSLIHGSASEYAASVDGARGGGGRADSRVDGGSEPYLGGGFPAQDAMASMVLQEQQRQQQQHHAGPLQSDSFSAWTQGHGGSADVVQVAPWGSTGTAARGVSAAATAAVWGEGGDGAHFSQPDAYAGTGALNMNMLHLGARGAQLHAASGDGRGVGAFPHTSLGFLGGTQGQVVVPLQTRQGLSAQRQRGAPPGLTAGPFAGLLGSLGASPDEELTGIADDRRAWRRSGDRVDEDRASGASSMTPHTPPGLSALLAEPNWGSSGPGPARTGTGGGLSPTGTGRGQTASSVVSSGSGASAPPYGGHVDLGLPLSSMDPTRAKELATAALRLLPRGGGR
jgi:hypothetical protein